MKTLQYFDFWFNSTDVYRFCLKTANITKPQIKDYSWGMHKSHMPTSDKITNKSMAAG